MLDIDGESKVFSSMKLNKKDTETTPATREPKHLIDDSTLNSKKVSKKLKKGQKKA